MLTANDIGNTVTIENERGARYRGRLDALNGRNEAFITVTAINLGDRWERLKRPEIQKIKERRK